MSQQNHNFSSQPQKEAQAQNIIKDSRKKLQSDYSHRKNLKIMKKVDHNAEIDNKPNQNSNKKELLNNPEEKSKGEETKQLKKNKKIKTQSNIGKQKLQHFLPNLFNHEDIVKSRLQFISRLKEKNKKLEQLYKKKNKLFAQLNNINTQLTKKNKNKSLEQNSQKIQEYELEIRKDFNKIKIKNDKSQAKCTTRSKSLKISKCEPQSIQSLSKNHEVIDFIKRMHRQSYERKFNQIDEYSRLLRIDALNYSCNECTKSRCKINLVNSRIK